MQFRFFTIPVYGGEVFADELNHFLAASRILSINRQFVQDGGNSAWAVCVGFEVGGASNCAGVRYPWRWPAVAKTQRPPVC